VATTIVGSGTLGNMPAATGMSNQAHMIYGVNSARWFVFTCIAGDTTHINLYVSSSNDLSTASWATIGTGTQSPALNNSKTFTANEGRLFGLDYANIGSTDVVYLVANSSDTGTGDATQMIRATLTASVGTWGSWISGTNGASLNAPEGAAAGISTTSRAWLINSRLTTDRDVAGTVATNTDSGTSWTSGWGTATVIDNSMANTVNSSALEQLASGLMLLIADSGAVTATTTNHIYQKSSSATAWPANSTLSTIGSAMGTAQNKNDWGSVAVTTSDIHVVRRTGATAFEHRRYNGTSWAAGNTIPATGLTGHKAASGVFLATDGTSVWCFILDTDANNSVRYLKWTSSAWDASWSTLSVSDTVAKNNISGWDTVSNNMIGVIWTENASTPFAIMGSQLSLTAAAQDTPELEGRPYGMRGQNQMQQLLAV